MPEPTDPTPQEDENPEVVAHEEEPSFGSEDCTGHQNCISH